MAVEQPEGAAEQIDAGREQRRTHAVVVEHERLDQIVEMALVIRDVHDAAGERRLFGVLEVFGDAPDFPENRVERVLQRAIEAVALRGTQFVEIGLDPLARVGFRRPRYAPQVSSDVVARQDGFRDVVRPHAADYSRTLVNPSLGDSW